MQGGVARVEHSHAVVTSLGSGAEPKGPVRQALPGQAQANQEYRWTTSVRDPPLPEPVFPAPTTARPISTSTEICDRPSTGCVLPRPRLLRDLPVARRRGGGMWKTRRRHAYPSRMRRRCPQRTLGRNALIADHLPLPGAHRRSGVARRIRQRRVVLVVGRGPLPTQQPATHDPAAGRVRSEFDIPTAPQLEPDVGRGPGATWLCSTYGSTRSSTAAARTPSPVPAAALGRPAASWFSFACLRFTLPRMRQSTKQSNVG